LNHDEFNNLNLNNKEFKITAKQVNPKTNARKTTRLLSVQPFGERRQQVRQLQVER
jgi:hypothetical protein